MFKKTLDWWFASCVKVKQENGFKIKMYAQVVDNDIWSWVLFHQLIWRLKINYILKVPLELEIYQNKNHICIRTAKFLLFILRYQYLLLSAEHG